MKVSYEITAKLEGNLSEIEGARVAPFPTLAEVLDTMQKLAFVVETLAHLQGKERELLPTADKAREQIAALTA